MRNSTFILYRPFEVPIYIDTDTVKRYINRRWQYFKNILFKDDTIDYKYIRYILEISSNDTIDIDTEHIHILEHLSKYSCSDMCQIYQQRELRKIENQLNKENTLPLTLLSPPFNSLNTNETTIAQRLKNYIKYTELTTDTIQDTISKEKITQSLPPLSYRRSALEPLPKPTVVDDDNDNDKSNSNNNNTVNKSSTDNEDIHSQSDNNNNTTKKLIIDDQDILSPNDNNCIAIPLSSIGSNDNYEISPNNDEYLNILESICLTGYNLYNLSPNKKIQKENIKSFGITCFIQNPLQVCVCKNSINSIKITNNTIKKKENKVIIDQDTNLKLNELTKKFTFNYNKEKFIIINGIYISLWGIYDKFDKSDINYETIKDDSKIQYPWELFDTTDSILIKNENKNTTPILPWITFKKKYNIINLALYSNTYKSIWYKNKSLVNVSSICKDDIILLEQIGIGQNGTVWKGQYIGTLTYVAIKSYKIDIINNNLSQQINELHAYKILSSNYNHIIKQYGTFIEEEKIILVTEYMDGGDLSNFIKINGPLKENCLQDIIKQILYGLYDLHNNNIIHRDIKPQNIFLSYDGTIKIGDLGLCYIVDTTINTGTHNTAVDTVSNNTTVNTDTNNITVNIDDSNNIISINNNNNNTSKPEFVGTLTFLSPERLRNQQYTNKSDIWALGCTILYCICGVSCVEGYMFWDVLENALSLPERVDDCIKSCKYTYSNNFYNFIHCIQKLQPDERYDINNLLQHPWLYNYTIKKVIYNKPDTKLSVSMGIERILQITLYSFLHGIQRIDINNIPDILQNILNENMNIYREKKNIYIKNLYIRIYDKYINSCKLKNKNYLNLKDEKIIKYILQKIYEKIQLQYTIYQYDDSNSKYIWLQGFFPLQIIDPYIYTRLSMLLHCDTSTARTMLHKLYHNHRSYFTIGSINMKDF